MAFVKLLNKNGTTLTDAEHDLCLYKVKHQENMSVTCIPLEPYFYITKLGYAGVYLFFLFFLQNIDCGYLANR